MNYTELPLVGAYLIKPDKNNDSRGSFSRVYCKDDIENNIGKTDIIQINHSITKQKGTVRGMHFQYFPYCEIKIVKCIKGAVYDVIVDIRKDSKTFLCWHGEIINSDNMHLMYVPHGFAHGFQTLEDNSEVVYFTSERYKPNNEGALNCEDPKLSIQWPLTITQLSEKDRNHTLLDESYEGIKID